MTEAWHAEQLAAIAPAPDLVNQHEPSEACGDTHCHWHHVDEPGEGAFRVCGECGHVYVTSLDLMDAEREQAAAGGYIAQATPGQVLSCPLCAHDW